MAVSYVYIRSLFQVSQLHGRADTLNDLSHDQISWIVIIPPEGPDY